ncbi:hypothetical protein EVAR_43781_1 [Eumeta japonica]|uniref:Uncharacterized protein n=1 Tax=Eumeta variegata TaxID=151549 RepID=A0A4C1XVX2_EUMVA|nr:hypothetical protein EVAR_43781_1 [Eumeta japonica]
MDEVTTLPTNAQKETAPFSSKRKPSRSAPARARRFASAESPRADSGARLAPRAGPILKRLRLLCPLPGAIVEAESRRRPAHR